MKHLLLIIMFLFSSFTYTNGLDCSSITQEPENSIIKLLSENEEIIEP